MRIVVVHHEPDDGRRAEQRPNGIWRDGGLDHLESRRHGAVQRHGQHAVGVPPVASLVPPHIVA
eukprot:5459787-Pyramimonas_sp.AAC.2